MPVIVATWLMAAALVGGEESAGEPPEAPIRCAGTYTGHLQGVATNGRDRIFWSFTGTLVRTNRAGEIAAKIDVPGHHGDLDLVGDRLYVAVNHGRFNEAEGAADSWVYVYDADSLRLQEKKAVPQVVHGAGGIACDGKRFLIVGGLPAGHPENYLYEFDLELNFRRRHTLASGYTMMGIQTAAYANGTWYFGCYGIPQVLLTADDGLRLTGKFPVPCAYGIAPLAEDRLWVAKGPCDKQGCIGELIVGRKDPQRGLRLP